MIDIHCHILYGVDDGARNKIESLRMLDAAKRVGINGLVFTPHIRHTQFPVNRPLIEKCYQELKLEAAQRGIKTKLGFEVYWKTLLEYDESNWQDWCFEGTNLLLLEFSIGENEAPQGMLPLLRRLKALGINVIIAHPERYGFVQKDPYWATRWHDMGCSIQLEGACLVHRMEWGSRKACRRLYRESQADYLASDAHRPEHYDLFARGLRWARKRTEWEQ